MTSESPRNAFVWVWLPGEAHPVVAGRIDAVGGELAFTYGQSYLNREGSIPLYLPDLPLGRGPISPLIGSIAGCLADSGPDAWGQRVILNRLVGIDAEGPAASSDLTYFLESGSDRIGAFDFQRSGSTYRPRSSGEATLVELAESAERVDRGVKLSPALDQALLHGSSIGGARPKALLADGPRKLIAKFSSSTDTFPVVKGEFVAMELARRAGINAATVELASALGRDVLLIDRFDRAGDARRIQISALTILGLDVAGAPYASYANLAAIVRARFTEPRDTLRELFSRITFNVLTGNTDDHPRNHAAFWGGEYLTLTPAYDICPQRRSGGEAAQLMSIGEDGWRYSQVAGCVERSETYLLTQAEARRIVDHQVEVIETEWEEVCAVAEMTEVDRAYFWNRQFLNPYALLGY